MESSILEDFSLVPNLPPCILNHFDLQSVFAIAIMEMRSFHQEYHLPDAITYKKINEANKVCSVNHSLFYLAMISEDFIKEKY